MPLGVCEAEPVGDLLNTCTGRSIWDTLTPGMWGQGCHLSCRACSMSLFGRSYRANAISLILRARPIPLLSLPNSSYIQFCSLIVILFENEKCKMLCKQFSHLLVQNTMTRKSVSPVGHRGCIQLARVRTGAPCLSVSSL